MPENKRKLKCIKDGNLQTKISIPNMVTKDLSLFFFVCSYWNTNNWVGAHVEQG
jgi:hypothetical protein